MNSLRVYEPRQALGWGPSVWREIFENILQARELIQRLFLRDLVANYKQSILGTVWVVVAPIIAVATFLFLSRSGLLQIEETSVPYPIFAFVGITFWQLFAGGLTACTNAIVAGGSMVTKIRFPREALVFAAIGQPIVDLLVRLVIVGLLLAFYGVAPSPASLLFPLPLLALLLLTLGLGLLLSLLNAILRDISKALTPLLTFLLFMTPVLYPAPEGSTLAAINFWNPVAQLVTAARDMLFLGEVSSVGPVLAAVVFSLLVFGIGLRLFHLLECRIAERI